MPRGDGTGPVGRNAGCRKNSGAGIGAGHGGRFHGPEGQCTCPECGEKIPHSRGQQCNRQKCPKCGCAMTREQAMDVEK